MAYKDTILPKPTNMTIALIDKHPIALRGLYLLLKNQFKEVTILQSDSVLTFYKLFRSQNPDIIILGISQDLNDNNVGFINLIKQNHPKAAIILYDENPGSTLVFHYLKTGIFGYLSKQNNVNELTKCIKSVLNGKKYMSDEILNLILNQHITEKNDLFIDNGLLTSREYEIAHYLSQGMKTSLIAQTLGRKMSTISTIKTNIFKKLQVRNILELRELMKPDNVT